VPKSKPNVSVKASFMMLMAFSNVALAYSLGPGTIPKPRA